MRTRSRAALLVPLALLLVLGACADDPPAEDTSTGLDLDDEQQARLAAIVSVFENSTTEVQYAYVEDLDDGRGYTAGRAGFTSATADLLDVVERYVQQAPDAALAAHLPELRRLAEDESDDTAGLDGFVEAWEAAATDDPALREAQDEVVEQTYLGPARSRAEELGISQPVGLAVLCDTVIQHGDGDDPDGLTALIDETTEREDGTPDDGKDEDAWLLAFLEVRRAHLEDAADPATREEWAESVDRVDALETLVDEGPSELDRSFTLEVYGDAIEVP